MDAKSRKRGVIASRAKLHAAMLNAGIKTQTALADKIADLEGLASPPRDTVNRAFRQESVSPASIARIAKAISVDAYMLYLSADEQANLADRDTLTNSSSGKRSVDNPQASISKEQLPPQSAASINSSIAPSKRYFKFYLISGLVLAIVIALIWIARGYLSDSLTNTIDSSETELTELADSTFNDENPSHSETQPEAVEVNIPEGASVIVFSKDVAVDEMSALLKQKLLTHYSAALAERSLVSKRSMATDIAEQFQADAVLTVRYEPHDRYAIVQVYLSYKNRERLLWTGSFSKVELSYQIHAITEQAYSAFNRAAGKPYRSELLSGNLLALAPHHQYLQARELLDGHNSELNVKKAQAILLSTVVQHPNFANARAALCEAYLRESWREHEKNSLEYAEKECSAGYQLSQNNDYLNAMRGYLYRRSGKVEQSIKLFEDALKISPNNVDSISGIAMAYRDAVRQQLPGYPNAEQQMLAYAKKATELEPDFWLHHNNLGVLSYTAGKTEMIALAFEKSAILNPSELAFANVATINLCQGNLEKAVGFYRDSIQQGPDSYIGYETIGTAYMFSKQFGKAVTNKEKALSLMSDKEFGGLYQMWGDLGDAYRLNKNSASAVEAYKKALTIIHREELRGNFTQADKAFKAYYIQQLTKLAKSDFQQPEFSFDYQQLKPLLTAEMEASAKAKLAFAFYLLGDVEQARVAMKRATDVCVVYHQHPDWLAFEGKSS